MADIEIFCAFLSRGGPIVTVETCGHSGPNRDDWLTVLRDASDVSPSRGMAPSHRMRPKRNFASSNTDPNKQRTIDIFARLRSAAQ